MSVSNNLKATLCHIDQLPVLPGIAIKILEKTKDPNTSLNQVAEILATDPPLSAKVLNVVNSPFFGLSRKITNLPHAVNLLGEKSLKYIALSFSLIHAFNNNKKQFDYASFWQKSLTCAVVSRLIAKDLGRCDAEDIYFLGLIHNIGILAMIQSHPGQYSLVLKKIKDDDLDYHVAENAIFTCNHMDVGAFLIESWGLPSVFVLPVLNHHYPDNIPLTHKNQRIGARIIHVSNAICRFLHAADKTESLAIVNQLLKNYNMNRRVNLEAVVEKACTHIQPLLPLFDIDQHNSFDYLKILDESKKEMYRLSFEMIGKIKEQEKTIDRLNILASQDGLTSLKNYKSFQDSLKKELAGSRRHGYTSVLALADLDGFKAVNDQYGHIAGDHVLQEVSRLFMENTRETDIIARYGGEEFAFILTRTCIQEGFKTIDRLRAMLSELKIEYQGHTISVTMSVGVLAFSGNDNLTGTELLKRVDAAMYQAKNSGKNKTFMLHS